MLVKTIKPELNVQSRYKIRYRTKCVLVKKRHPLAGGKFAVATSGLQVKTAGRKLGKLFKLPEQMRRIGVATFQRNLRPAFFGTFIFYFHRVFKANNTNKQLRGNA